MTAVDLLAYILIVLVLILGALIEIAWQVARARADYRKYSTMTEGAKLAHRR